MPVITDVNVKDVKSYENVKGMIDSVGGILGLSEKKIEFLKTPEKEIKAHITIKRESTQDIETFISYIILHRSPRKEPFKGGIRFHPSVTRDLIRILATEMTLKCWLLGLPFGGAKSGIVCGPNSLTQKELEALTKGFVNEARRDLGPFIYVPAPDMGSGKNNMLWIWDQFNTFIPDHDNKAVVTGKPPEFGGCRVREEATGRGLCIVQDMVLDALGIRKNAENTTIVVQGFGNVGSHYAKLAFNEGFKIIAVSDVNGAIYNRHGLDIPRLLNCVKENNTLIDFQGSENISSHELFSFPCDILAPCAVENALNDSNADAIKAKIILEGANAPTTPRADEIFKEKNIVVVPDILANAGGVTVSYFEWSKNTGQSITMQHDDAVIKELERYLQIATLATLDKSDELKVSLRKAAYILAIERIKDTYDMVGWTSYP